MFLINFFNLIKNLPFHVNRFCQNYFDLPTKTLIKSLPNLEINFFGFAFIQYLQTFVKYFSLEFHNSINRKSNFFVYKTFMLLLVSQVFVDCSSTNSRIVQRNHPENAIVIPAEQKFYDSELSKLKGKSLVLVTNPSGIGNRPEFLKQKLKENQVELKFLIGLEHGFLGLEEDFGKDSVSMDKTFQLPIYHIYKLKKGELSHILQGVDVILFDVQDVGMRCYTYLTVLKRIMDNISSPTQLVVIDHIHPSLSIGIFGDKLDPKFHNFAGEFPSLLFTGMTMGEAALYYNSEYLSNRIKLQIITVDKFKRNMQFEETGLVWNTPSPNLPNLDSTRNYFGLVLLEGIHISVGRGTQAPFVYFGAPWMKEPEKLINELHKISKNKYYFQKVYFKPAFGPYKNEICYGLRMSLVEQNYDPIELGYSIISLLKKYYPSEFRWRGKFVDNLWGSDRFRKAIDNQISYKDFRESFEKYTDEFTPKIKKYFLYPLE